MQTVVADTVSSPGKRGGPGRLPFRLLAIGMVLALPAIVYCLVNSDPLGLLPTTQETRVDCLAFAPDGMYLAARRTSRRGVTARGWNQAVRDVQLFSLGDRPGRRSLTRCAMFLPGTTVEEHNALAFSADGATLAAACDSIRGGVEI